jgi:hypothetical protein
MKWTSDANGQLLAIAEADTVAIEPADPGVADGDAVNVVGEIAGHLLVSQAKRLDIMRKGLDVRRKRLDITRKKLDVRRKLRASSVIESFRFSRN